MVKRSHLKIHNYYPIYCPKIKKRLPNSVAGVDYISGEERTRTADLLTASQAL